MQQHLPKAPGSAKDMVFDGPGMIAAVREDHRARVAGVAMIDRFRTTVDFQRMAVPEQAQFTAVRERTHCAGKLIAAYLAGQN